MSLPCAFVHLQSDAKTESFKSISSHWDVTPSLIHFLMNNYKLNKMEKTTWMSQGLDTVKNLETFTKFL
jgi:hypothetical protein